jgi:hypothetical protein
MAPKLNDLIKIHKKGKSIKQNIEAPSYRIVIVPLVGYFYKIIRNARYVY